MIMHSVMIFNKNKEKKEENLWTEKCITDLN